MGNRRITRRQFIRRGGAATLGASFAGALLAGCGGGSEGGSGQVAYWSNLEGSGPQDYFGKNIELDFSHLGEKGVGYALVTDLR